MCNATDGATPVYLCTCAASAIFSNGSRGTPGCANTLNRVPELPNAHEGSSMCWLRSTSATAARSTIALPAFLTYGSVSTRGDVHQVHAEKVCGGPQLGQDVADAERPVVRNTGRAPGIGPLAGVTA